MGKFKICNCRRLLPDAVDSRGGADEEIFSGDGWSGHAHVVVGQSVGVVLRGW